MSVKKTTNFFDNEFCCWKNAIITVFKVRLFFLCDPRTLFQTKLCDYCAYSSFKFKENSAKKGVLPELNLRLAFWSWRIWSRDNTGFRPRVLRCFASVNLIYKNRVEACSALGGLVKCRRFFPSEQSIYIYLSVRYLLCINVIKNAGILFLFTNNKLSFKTRIHN